MRKIARIGEPGGERSIEQLAQRLSEIETRIALADDPTHGLDWSDESLAAVATRIYAGRRRRERLFDAAIFADPAWDMLLDLFIARARGKQVPTVSLCIAATAPASTALRWIAVLERQGLVERNPALDDRRTKIITLTDLGYRVMRQYLIEGIETRELPAVDGPPDAAR